MGGEVSSVICGIGLNLNSAPAYATSLASYGSELNKQEIGSLLGEFLARRIEEHLTKGLRGFLAPINERLWPGVAQTKDGRQGVATSVTPDGHLLLTHGGHSHVVASAELLWHGYHSDSK